MPGGMTSVPEINRSNLAKESLRLCCSMSTEGGESSNCSTLEMELENLRRRGATLDVAGGVELKLWMLVGSMTTTPREDLLLLILSSRRSVTSWKCPAIFAIISISLNSQFRASSRMTVVNLFSNRNNDFAVTLSPCDMSPSMKSFLSMQATFSPCSMVSEVLRISSNSMISLLLIFAALHNSSSRDSSLSKSLNSRAVIF
mmetsp:Transcript_30620/g.88355  ORF Transcript_30620/g.88355 Transcript_30620/m.88355 type:complete len:201 (-) Transcript_30620:634-1236(-)